MKREPGRREATGFFALVVLPSGGATSHHPGKVPVRADVARALASFVAVLIAGACHVPSTTMSGPPPVRTSPTVDWVVRFPVAPRLSASWTGLRPEFGDPPTALALVRGLPVELPSAAHPNGRAAAVASSDLVFGRIGLVGDRFLLRGLRRTYVVSDVLDTPEVVPLELDSDVVSYPLRGTTALFGSSGELVSIGSSRIQSISLPRPVARVESRDGELVLELEPGLRAVLSDPDGTPRIVGGLGRASSVGDAAMPTGASDHIIPLPPPLSDSYVLGGYGAPRSVASSFDEVRRRREVAARYVFARAIGALDDGVQPPRTFRDADPRANLSDVLDDVVEGEFFDDGAIVTFPDGPLRDLPRACLRPHDRASIR